MSTPTKTHGTSDLATIVAQATSLEAAYERLQAAHDDARQTLRALIEFAPEAIVMYDVADHRFIDANPMAERLFGLSREELLRSEPFSVSPPMQPSGTSLARGKALIADAVEGRNPIFEWWHCNRLGERIPCEVRLTRIPWAGRDVLLATIVDISPRKRLELADHGRCRILDCISRGVPLSEALCTLVDTIEELLPGMLCSVLLLDRQTNRLRLGAAPHLPDEYNSAVDGVEIGPTIGSCGAAAYTNQRVIVCDVATHPNWAAYRELTSRLGVRACWSEPIRSFSADVLGTFAMYYREPCAPAPVEIHAIEIAAQLAAIVIEHERTQKSLREMNESLEQRVAEETRHLTEANCRLLAAEQELRLAAVAFETHDSVMITDCSGKILRVNHSFTDLTGYPPEEVIGKTPRVLKSGRHGPDYYHQMWEAIARDGFWEGEIWNRRRNGTEYLQRLTITSVTNSAGETTHYVADGQDVTDQKRAADDRAAIDAARKVQGSLFPLTSPNLPGFTIAGAVRPAARVSGDYFDYLPMGPDAWGILVADVSGHGFGPALLMAQMQAYLRALAEFHSDPAALLTQANRLFLTNRSGHFVTALLLRLDPRSRSFVHAGAGHRGYLVRRNGDVRVLASASLPLGIQPGLKVAAGPLTSLEPGDVIVLPTDGIEEARRPTGETFGQSRLLQIVREHRDRSAGEIVDALVQRACEFTEAEPQADDITAVAIKAEG